MRLIDADELKANVNNWYDLVNSFGQTNIQLSHKDILAKIDNMSTIETKPIVYGEWLIYKTYQGGIKEEWLKCSKCGWENALLIPRNFCPNCGATMKQKRERVE